MNFHILNGDALAERFPQGLHGEIIIIREAFMDGPLSTDLDDADFWRTRADYIEDTYKENAQTYLNHFLKHQLTALHSIKKEDQVYLWFEDDLFCQANMWFVIYYITRHVQPSFHRVFPLSDTIYWTGFGKEDHSSLGLLFKNSTAFATQEIQKVILLWEAYVVNDEGALKRLAAEASPCLRFLPDVIEAHLARIPKDQYPGKPKQILQNILGEGKKTFTEIFSLFSRQAGIYGYSDVQVKGLLKEMGYSF